MIRFELQIGPETLAHVDGRPNLPTKNRYFTVGRVGGPRGRATILLSTEAKSFVQRLGGLVLRAGHHCDPSFPLIDEGSWRLTLVQFAPRRREKTDLALLDSDACLSPVKDALQKVGVLSNDMVIVEDRTFALYRKGRPGLTILLERLSDSDLEAIRARWSR